MGQNSDEYSYKEVWHVLSKMPLSVIAKIPFEIRNNISEKAERCESKLQEINLKLPLKDIDISDKAKEILLSIYLDYWADDDIKDKVKRFINFYNNN